jgi:hypothetical protein
VRDRFRDKASAAAVAAVAGLSEGTAAADEAGSQGATGGEDADEEEDDESPGPNPVGAGLAEAWARRARPRLRAAAALRMSVALYGSAKERLSQSSTNEKAAHDTPSRFMAQASEWFDGKSPLCSQTPFEAPGDGNQIQIPAQDGSRSASGPTRSPASPAQPVTIQPKAYPQGLG